MWRNNTTPVTLAAFQSHKNVTLFPPLWCDAGATKEHTHLVVDLLAVLHGGRPQGRQAVGAGLRIRVQVAQGLLASWLDVGQSPSGTLMGWAQRQCDVQALLTIDKLSHYRGNTVLCNMYFIPRPWHPRVGCYNDLRDPFPNHSEAILC